MTIQQLKAKTKTNRIMMRLNAEGDISLILPPDPEIVNRVKSIKGVYPSGLKHVFNTRFNPDLASFLFNKLDITIALDETYYLRDLVEWMTEHNYSLNTIRSYLMINASLLRSTSKLPGEIELEDIRRFNMRQASTQGNSSPKMNVHYNAFKLYYGKIHGKRFFTDLERPSQKQLKPEYLSTDEVKRLLLCRLRPRDFLLLALAYSSGLQSQEISRLRLMDFHPEPGILHIPGSPRGTGRLTALSQPIWRRVLRFSRALEPDELIFTSQDGQGPLSPRTMEHICDRTRKAAGLDQKVNLRSLRQSFAAHLREQSLDPILIRRLMGYKKDLFQKEDWEDLENTLHEFQNPLEIILRMRKGN